MKAKILGLLLLLGMCIGMGDVNAQSRAQRWKSKWKKTFGTPRNPKAPPVPKGFPKPPAPPKAPAPRKVPPPPKPVPPPVPPAPPAPPVPR